MTLYHCISTLAPLRMGRLQCRDNESIAHRHEPLLALFRLESYRNWRAAGKEGVNATMDDIEERLFVTLAQTPKRAIMLNTDAYNRKIVLACEIDEKECYVPCYGDVSTTMPDLRIVPLGVDLRAALRQVAVQQHMNEEVVEALRASTLTPEVIPLFIADTAKYPFYNASGAGV